MATKSRHPPDRVEARGSASRKESIGAPRASNAPQRFGIPERRGAESRAISDVTRRILLIAPAFIVATMWGVFHGGVALFGVRGGYVAGFLVYWIVWGYDSDDRSPRGTGAGALDCGERARPLVIGPDAESAQWAESVAAFAGAPVIVATKVRRGDADVIISMPETVQHRDRTPVLVDDIISTAQTMSQTARHLRSAGLRAPVCVGVHAVFVDGAYDQLRVAGAERVVTCNTITHPSNAIDVFPPLATAVIGAMAAG